MAKNTGLYTVDTQYTLGGNDDELGFLCLYLCKMPLDIGLYIEVLSEYLWVMTNISSDYLINSP